MRPVTQIGSGVMWRLSVGPSLPFTPFPAVSPHPQEAYPCRPAAQVHLCYRISELQQPALLSYCLKPHSATHSGHILYILVCNSSHRYTVSVDVLLRCKINTNIKSWEMRAAMLKLSTELPSVLTISLHSHLFHLWCKVPEAMNESCLLLSSLICPLTLSLTYSLTLTYIHTPAQVQKQE